MGKSWQDEKRDRERADAEFRERMGRAVLDQIQAQTGRQVMPFPTQDDHEDDGGQAA